MEDCTAAEIKSPMLFEMTTCRFAVKKVFFVSCACTEQILDVIWAWLSKTVKCHVIQDSAGERTGGLLSEVSRSALSSRSLIQPNKWLAPVCAFVVALCVDETSRIEPKLITITYAAEKNVATVILFLNNSLMPHMH